MCRQLCVVTRNDLIATISMTDPFLFITQFNYLFLVDLWLYPWAVQVELFKHPHLLLLQVRNTVYRLPGGRLRPGESGNANGLQHTFNQKYYARLVGGCLHWAIRYIDKSNIGQSTIYFMSYVLSISSTVHSKRLCDMMLQILTA